MCVCVCVCVCVCNQGYQTGYVYLGQAERTGSDAELAPSTGVASSLTGSDRDLARLGLASRTTCDVVLVSVTAVYRYFVIVVFTDAHLFE